MRDTLRSWLSAALAALGILSLIIAFGFLVAAALVLNVQAFYFGFWACVCALACGLASWHLNLREEKD